MMFWHRLFNQHTWITKSETVVEGKDFDSIEFTSTYALDRITKLMSGYKIIHQECEICGDRRVIHEF